MADIIMLTLTIIYSTDDFIYTIYRLFNKRTLDGQQF